MSRKRKSAYRTKTKTVDGTKVGSIAARKSGTLQSWKVLLAVVAFVPTVPLIAAYVAYFQIPEDRTAAAWRPMCNALNVVYLTPRACDVDLLVREARTAFDRKNNEKASKLVEKALTLSDEQPQALVLRGELELRAGDQRNAERDFDVAITKSSFHRAYYGRAIIEFKREQVGSALADVDEALARAPNETDYHIMKALLISKRDGQFNDAATEEIDEAIKLNPEDVDLFSFKVMAIAPTSIRRAIQIANEGISKHPKNSKMYTMRALYESSYDQVAAENDYAKAIELMGPT